MALVLKDRIKETTTTTGTGTYTLAGAVTGFEAFSQIGNSNTLPIMPARTELTLRLELNLYCIWHNFSSYHNITESSNSDNEVNWTSGTELFFTLPAEKAVFLDASNAAGFTEQDPNGVGIRDSIGIEIWLTHLKHLQTPQ